jgi:hypothetical protein
MKKALELLWKNTWPFAIPAVYFAAGLVFGLLNSPE